MAFSAVGALNWMKAANANYREDQLRQENLRTRREDALLSLYLKNGGTYGSKKNGEKYNSAAKNALLLQDRVKNSELDPQDVKFYNDILEDPMAAEEVMAFLEEQETKFNRVIPLSDVPQYINIVNAPNIPVEEKIDIFKELDLVDLTDKEEYYKLASRIQNMTTKSGRTVFTDVVPGSQIDQSATIKLAEEQYTMMTELLVPNAQTWLSANPDPANPQAIETAKAIQNINSNEPLKKAEARKYLFETYTTKDFVAGLEKNMPEYFRGLSKVPQIKTLLDAQAPFAVPTPEDIQLLKSNPSEEMKQKFNTIYGPGAADRVLNDN